MTAANIERSIYKEFKKSIWKKFLQGVKEYKLINENDKVMVCISGGKDSLLLAMCIRRLEKYGSINFKAEYVIMNPGYNKKNFDLIKKNMKLLDLPLKVFDSDIFNIVKVMDVKSPCYMCARMRRGFLYSIAKELGSNKIALGHHFDDVIETILLSMIYGGEIRTMMPKLHSENFENIELIRPLYLVKEEFILKWKEFNDLKFIDCACDLSGKDEEGKNSKRDEMKELITKFRKINPLIESNIFRSVENINIGAIIGYKDKDNLLHNFLDDYDK